MSEMVEVVIDSVRVSLMSPQRLVVLRQTDAERYLPIWVGPYEAEAITVALQEIEMIRPLTHDLLKNLFATFNARIRRVEIVALRDDIFYGNIVAESNGQVINIDSRPSDAIALAVRARVPILVDAEVMSAASITPEQDMRSQTASNPGQQTAPSAPAAPSRSGPVSSPRPFSDDASRLSIFEDFLSKLEKGKQDDDEENAPPGPK
ncbi:MAG: bifunctional nuclease family protein [Anaerolineales bacterium]|nr:bifunctional nuclease family protein [Anaerolineales bacterium]MCX7756165.1 bifunctional nuclease family protein [Anaerolineales bacterium]MDW8277212.1 bifunctional nuclease family protein [Anaerolineales bacterium]